MHIQNHDITSATTQKYIWHPTSGKLYSLNCWYYSVVYKQETLSNCYNHVFLQCPLCST